MSTESNNPNGPNQPPTNDDPGENGTITTGEGASGGSDSSGGGPGVLGGINRTWLYAGGGGLAAVVVVVIVLVVALSGGGPAVPSDPMGLVLDDASEVWRIDVQSINDGDVQGDVEDFIEGWFEPRVEAVDISLDDVETAIYVRNSDRYSSMLAVQGSFDFEDIRDELDDLDYDDDEYRGYELWEGGRNSIFSDVALLGDQQYVVLGFADDPEVVQEVLKALDRDQDLLAQQPDSGINKAMAKAGEGWLVIANNHCDNDDIRGCESGSVSFSGGDRDSADAKVAMLFRNESSAERGADDIEDLIDDHGLPYWHLPTDWDIEEVESDGEFVVAEVTAYFDN